MRRSTKGALAGMAAIALLLGGFGTHASWTDTQTVANGDITNGSLKLTGAGCGDWELFKDATDAATGLVSKALAGGSLTSLYLLPGQVLTRHCEFTVALNGVGTVDATINTPTFTPGAIADGNGGVTLVTDLTKTHGSDDSTLAGGAATSVANGDVISADFTATLADGATQTLWEGVASTLASLTVTASLA